MKLKTKFLYSLGSAAASFCVPLLARAVNDVETGMSSLRTLFPISGIGGSRSIGDLIVNVIRLMLSLAGLIAVFFIILGGYWYITSAGNAETAEKGKNALVNAIIGIVIIILSYVIVNVVSRTINCPTGSWFC